MSGPKKKDEHEWTWCNLMKVRRNFEQQSSSEWPLDLHMYIFWVILFIYLLFEEMTVCLRNIFRNCDKVFVSVFQSKSTEMFLYLWTPGQHFTRFVKWGFLVLTELSMAAIHFKLDISLLMLFICLFLLDLKVF